MREKLVHLWGSARMNTSGLGRLFNFALILQLAAFIAIFIDIPVFRQVVGFFYLSFLPGFLFLKVIRLEKTGLIEYILYSVGFSVVFLMLFGLLSGLLYPALNLLKPLVGYPIIATMLVFTFVLYIASWFRTRKEPALRNGNPSEQTFTNLKSLRILIPLLICIPILTIFGTELLLSSGNNFVLLLLVVITSAIVLCSFSERIVPKVVYPLVVIAISLFLLFHTSLVSNYVIGYDVHLELYLANITFNRGVWDLTIPHEYNAMLSVTVLPVVYSTFLNLNLNSVFKLVYPLIYSMVPLSLFVAYRKLTGSRIAFLSVFFFMAIDTFYFTMLGLDRQMIGEFFLALLVLLLVEERISLPKKTFLFAVFSAGLVVSHYSTTYLFLFLILFAFYFSRFIKRSAIERPRLISGGLALGCVAMAFVWYIAVAPTPFDALAATFDNIRQGLLSSAAAPGISGLTPVYFNVLQRVSEFLFYGLQLSIIVGLFGAIFLYKKMKFDELYLSMSLLSFLVMVFCIVLPSFAAGLVVERFYHFASFFLAPFVVLGILAMYDWITTFKRNLSRSMFRKNLDLKRHLSRFLARLNFKNKQATDLKVKGAGLFLVSLILVFFFLFKVGFIYEVVGNQSSSISLSYERILVNPTQNLAFWSACTPEEDVVSASWLHDHMNSQSNIYADKPSSMRVLASYGLYQTIYFTDSYHSGTYAYLLTNATAMLEPNSYVYLRTLNVVYGILEGSTTSWNTTTISPLLSDCNVIYSNGASQIYKPVI
jgi:uncharacterized membrane protein